jgi:hypothetical protein
LTERTNTIEHSYGHLQKRGLERDVCTEAINALYDDLDKREMDIFVYTVIDMTMDGKDKRLWTLNVSTGVCLLLYIDDHTAEIKMSITMV